MAFKEEKGHLLCRSYFGEYFYSYFGSPGRLSLKKQRLYKIYIILEVNKSNSYLYIQIPFGGRDIYPNLEVSFV